jgi:hypothetical protein
LADRNLIYNLIYKYKNLVDLAVTLALDPGGRWDGFGMMPFSQ